MIDDRSWRLGFADDQDLLTLQIEVRKSVSHAGSRRTMDRVLVFALGPHPAGTSSGRRTETVFKELSQKEILLPNGTRKRISLSTLRRKVRRFRLYNIDGLRRQSRTDHGQCARTGEAIVARAIRTEKGATVPFPGRHQ